MRIDEALKETGIVTPDYINIKKHSFAKLLDGVLYWHDIKEGNCSFPVSLHDINNIKWQPYHEVKEIRPEKAGELWVSRENEKDTPFFTTESGEAFPVNNHLVIRNRSGLSLDIKGCFEDRKIIHGKNGWTLIYSPDKEVMKRIKDLEDDSVDRIEIENAWLLEGEIKNPGDPTSVGKISFRVGSDFFAHLSKPDLFQKQLRLAVELPKDLTKHP
jgi:hypothetical protein